ncbi:retrovirus-related pol polyprotein from transposon TNT 1-94 [Tanacetum coccineum]
MGLEVVEVPTFKEEEFEQITVLGEHVSFPNGIEVSFVLRQVPTDFLVGIHLRPTEVKILPVGLHVRQDIGGIGFTYTAEVLFGENVCPVEIQLLEAREFTSERFETYVNTKDLDLWHVITEGDFSPIRNNSETKQDEVVPFEKQNDDLKKKLAKNNEDKMVIYNAFQVKDNKIDLLVQQYEQFVISEDEYIDSAFARFNTIITSLKSLTEGYSNKNYFRKFLRALHPNWIVKVTTIEESKYLTSLSLYELIGKLKVHELIIKKDSEIVKGKGERGSLALKLKRNLVMKKVRLLEVKTKNTPWRLETSRSSSREEVGKVKTCLMAQASSEICLRIDLEPDEWIKDSGCTKHMTGNQKLFSTYTTYNGGNVIFSSNLRGNILGKGMISHDSLNIANVEHVDNLGFNLLNVSEIYDNKCKVILFEHDSEITKDGKVIGRGIRKSGLYVMKLGKKPKDKICLTTIDENFMLWHRRLAKNMVSTTRYLELLHMDLFGPSPVRSYEGNLYTLVILDDYSRMDHGSEFDNEVQFRDFCNANGITYNFSVLRTPQSNDMVERKNRTLQEMSRTMLNEQSLPQKFWCNFIDTSTYTLN